MLAAQIGDGNTGLMLFQNANDLVFGEPAALHLWSFQLGQSLPQTGLAAGGNVIAHIGIGMMVAHSPLRRAASKLLLFYIAKELAFDLRLDGFAFWTWMDSAIDLAAIRCGFFWASRQLELQGRQTGAQAKTFQAADPSVAPKE